MNKLSTSLLYMACLREALAQIVEASNVDHKKEIKNYILGAASDYQVLHLALRESVTDVETNFADEFALIKELTESLMLSEDENDSIVEIATELESLTPYGLSSSNLLSEGFEIPSNVTLIENEMEFYTNLVEGVWADRTNALLDVVDRVKGGVSGGFQSKVKTAGGALQKIEAKIDATKAAIKQAGYEIANARQIKDAARIQKATEKKQLLFKRLEAENRQMDTLKANWVELKRQISNKAAPHIAKAKDVGGKTAAKIGAASVAAGAAAKHQANVTGTKLGAKAIVAAKKYGGDEAAIKTAKAVQKVGTTNIGIAAGVAGAAAAAAAIYAGVKIYKRFFSQAAKACGGKSGSEKTACMTGFKKKALQAQISTVNKGLSACSKSKNPEKCKAVITKKVSKLKGQMAKL